MDARANAQRRRAIRKLSNSSVVYVQVKDDNGDARWVAANLVDVLSNGCGLALMTLLKSGSTVMVRGKLSGNRAADQLKASVRWCIAKADGTFRAGLEFLDCRSHPELDEDRTQSISQVISDCYDVLQLPPGADAASVSRAYRALAFRYHPDNKVTGDSEKFIRLSEAYELLSDPAKLASYDPRHLGAKRRRGTPAQSPAGVEREKQAAAYLGIGALSGTVCWEG